MKRRALLAALSAAALATACSTPKPKATQADVRPGLQQEADRLKADFEKMPGLGAQVTCRVVSLDIQEQADNPARPFRGTVKMNIESARQEPDGMKVSAIEKTFSFVYDAETAKWTFGS
jgi:hypothetical protein